jgi:hypothetical protein
MRTVRMVPRDVRLGDLVSVVDGATDCHAAFAHYISSNLERADLDAIYTERD